MPHLFSVFFIVASMAIGSYLCVSCAATLVIPTFSIVRRIGEFFLLLFSMAFVLIGPISYASFDASQVVWQAGSWNLRIGDEGLNGTYRFYAGAPLIILIPVLLGLAYGLFVRKNETALANKEKFA